MGGEISLTEEIWAPCPDGRGLYEVSSFGQVRSWNNNRWGRRNKPRQLRLNPTPEGYLSVNLGRGVVRLVHRLVCEAFHGPAPPGMEAAHRNGISSDSRAGNLRWATPVENCHDQLLHGRRRRGEQKKGARLTETDVREIRRLRAAGVENQAIAGRFGIAPTTASEVARGKKWAHVEGQSHGA